MKWNCILSIVLLFFALTIRAQQPILDSLLIKDSITILDEVIIKAFEENRKLSSTITSVKIIQLQNADRYNKTSLVNGFNSIAGVRMEERSPGSYRINIRGSSLRSPFGVRNVKVYWNSIPITDPGGNTYFNQFAYNNFSHIEISKGPAGSLYGAGTGGLVLMENFDNWKPGVNLEYLTGSYNLQNILASVRFGKGENKNQLTYAHNQTDGYRTHSSLRRDNLSWSSQLKISDRQSFSSSLLITKMFYETPSALTLAELNNNPKAARPAAGIFPSAQTAKAAIDQLNILVGFTHTYKITPVLSNQVTLYGAIAEIKNPAIRNYERRTEPSFGGRVFFTFQKDKDEDDVEKNKSHIKFIAGTEFQNGIFNTVVSGNRNGNPDTIQTNDDIVLINNSYFTQANAEFNNKWFITAGISLTKNIVRFTRLNNAPVTTQSKKYNNELAPRLAIKKMFNNNFYATATISRGFSPPSIGELLPSTGMISTNLQAEYGWNYELTLGKHLFNKKLRLDVTVFYLKLNKALVQRRDSSGADFFVNAGNTKQQGVELSADYVLFAKSNNCIDYLQLNGAFTLNHFRYGNFIQGTNDYSGKTIPSVPSHTFSMLADLQFKKGVYINFTYYSASTIFLNDANTAVAEAYQLLGCRIGFKNTFAKKYKMNFYAGADNLLDEMYSLGNDINAVSNRFYNAAPRRNYYVGLSIQWIKKLK